MPALPNIYLDANRSKRGLTLDLRQDEDRRRLLDLVGVADVVVENAVAGTWERQGLDEDHLRSVNPDLVYARAKGFGLHGPLASRPAFDYVVQAATGPAQLALGDAILKAKSGITDLAVRKTYNLLGDPAMQIKPPGSNPSH